jgi:hypothetical protein
MKDWDDSSPLAGTSRHDVKGLRGRCRVDRVFMQAVVTDRRFLLHYCGNPYVEKANQMLALRCAKYNGTFERVFEAYKRRALHRHRSDPP